MVTPPEDQPEEPPAGRRLYPTGAPEPGRRLAPGRLRRSSAARSAAACFSRSAPASAPSSLSALLWTRRRTAASYSESGGRSGPSKSSPPRRSTLTQRFSACRHTSSRSRPLSPTASRPSDSSSTGVRCLAYNAKILARAGASGVGKCTRTSKRESRAESRSVRRLVAATSVMSGCASIPSRRRRSTESMRREASSISREREPASASSSSRKRTHRPRAPQ
mmetsp:Transcript_19695/g.35618  ORF Transcript_19695/g.35618 Transcript_19695/m.35618 type:complete len:221 (+) Transcript_19695:160-822(+)